MIVAVTGASGHIGINLLPQLLKKGYQVRVLVHKNSKVLEKLNITPVHGDLLDKKSLVDCIDGAEIIIHLAGIVTIDKKSVEAMQVNVEGTRNLLQVAQELNVQKFIFFSSITSMPVFPLNNVFDESRELNFDSPFDYERSKALGEKMVMAASVKGLQTVILNPTAVIGPNDYAPSRLGRAVLQYYHGKIPALLNTGYNFIDVRDVVKATLGAMQVEGKGQRYILSGNWKSLKDFGETIHRYGGKKPPAVTVPFWLAKLGAGFLNYFTTGNSEEKLFTKASLETLENSHRNISNAKATRELGLEILAFDKSIRDTIEWFRKNNYL
jgi:dihydroflavonol-4-reductase